MELIEDNDIDGFKDYLVEKVCLMFDEPVEFETKQEALAFCAGICCGVDESMQVEILPLKSFEEYENPL